MRCLEAQPEKLETASWNMNFSSNLHNFHGETNVSLDYFNSDCSSIMIRFHLLRMVGRWRPILAVHPASRPKGSVSQQSLRIANANVSLQLMQLNAALHNSTQFRQLSKQPLIRRLEIYIFRAVRVFNWVGGGGEKEEKELKPPSWAPERRWSLSI